MRINILDQHLASQIAAGEVVERPSSVVKELIENSLDAGATEITITIENGGTKKIVVQDNGRGIHKDDLQLALCRHATSKIRNINDLNSIISLGFRGEALASISSVSRLTLTSKTAESDMGWQIVCLGDMTDVTIRPAASLIGTTIEIDDLFFNVPARKKFLKSAQTEFLHLEEVVSRIALSRFDVGFTLLHNNKRILQVQRSADYEAEKERVAKICGVEFMENAIPINAENSGLKLRGWIASPNYSRSQSDLQYYYVNGRMVRDKLLIGAVKHAYLDNIYHGRFPAVLLFLDIDPNLVDVNVHPAKTEVRFREARAVYDFIVKSIKETLAPLNITSQPTLDKIFTSQPTLEFNYSKPKMNLNDVKEQVSIFKEMFNVDRDIEEGEKLGGVLSVSKVLFPLGSAVGLLHGLYIIAQNEQGVVLIDVHAAHERITYEKLKRQLAAGTVKSQVLLIPVTVMLRGSEVDIILEQVEFLARLGFDIDNISDGTLVVRSIPMLLCNADIAQIIKDIASDFKVEDSSIAAIEKQNAILANLACRSSIRGKSNLSILEMNALLREMESTDYINQCNHGRPTWVQLSLADVDKFFMRGR